MNKLCSLLRYADALQVAASRAGALDTALYSVILILASMSEAVNAHFYNL